MRANRRMRVLTAPGRFERTDVRDIRDDLLERLNAIEAEMAAARTEYDAERRVLEANFAALFEDIHDRQIAISRILDLEARRMGEPSKRRAPSASAPFRLPLLDYILNFVAGHKKSKDEIKEAVDRAGYEGAGRTVHTTLLNMVRAGKLHVQDDLYEIANLGVLFLPATASNEEDPPPSNEGRGSMF